MFNCASKYEKKKKKIEVIMWLDNDTGKARRLLYTANIDRRNVIARAVGSRLKIVSLNVVFLMYSLFCYQMCSACR